MVRVTLEVHTFAPLPDQTAQSTLTEARLRSVRHALAGVVDAENIYVKHATGTSTQPPNSDVSPVKGTGVILLFCR